jgi:hypothetical protein
MNFSSCRKCRPSNYRQLYEACTPPRGVKSGDPSGAVAEDLRVVGNLPIMRGQWIIIDFTGKFYEEKTQPTIDPIHLLKVIFDLYSNNDNPKSPY